MRKIIFSLIFVTFTTISFAQLSVLNNYSAEQLGNNLAGSNITITNATVKGTSLQFGTFQFAGEGFPLSSGVVLSTGSIFDSPGPNSSSGTSSDFNGAGNALLDALSGMQTQDAVELTFSFTVQSDKIEFNYIFASEEYNEYVGSFNDVFAFFISGPGIVGEENIAVVPNTTVPVAINNINLENYWQYYNNNENGTTNLEFDGYTKVLTARKEGLIPCQTYTLKLVIADAGDGALNSGVFLQENSLVQGVVSASSNTFSENDIALEGCVNASFTLSFDSAQTSNTYINYKIRGTAVNGVDYKQIDTVLVVAAGQSSATIVIDAITDGISEGMESVELIYQPILCGGYDTIVMYIQDYQTLEFQSIPSDLSCFESGDGEINFNINGGAAPYTINLQDTTTGLMSTYTSFPITGLSDGTYKIQVLDAYGCWAEDIVAGANFDADSTFLPDGNGVSYKTSIEISGLPAGTTLLDVNQLQSICLEMEHSFMGDLLIQLEAPNGTLLTLKQQPGGAKTNLGEPVASGPNDNDISNVVPGVGYQYCFTNNPTFGTMVEESNSTTYTYTSQTGITLTDAYLPAGSYKSYSPLTNLIGTPLNGTWSIIVTDEIPKNNGYIFSWGISIAADKPDSIVTIYQPNTSDITLNTTLPTCGLNNGNININIIGGNSPFSFIWNTGETTQNISNLVAGTYSVTISDSSSCSVVKTVSLPNSSSANISSTVVNETCVDANNGSINLTVSGGTQPYLYSWFSGQNSEDITMLTPGNYSVQITDNIGCISASNFEILSASELILSGSSINETCGNIDGAINLSVFGATSPYTFSWSNGVSTQNISGLQQGTYIVTVSDANNCQKSKSFNVTNLVGDCIPNCDLSIQNSVISDENCGNSDGSILLDIFTSNLPYNVTWSNGFSSKDLTGIKEGAYNVTIIDAENCEISQSYTLNNIAGTLSLNSTVVNDEYCGNSTGEINITPTGGTQPYVYKWSNGAISQDISGLVAGNYDITLTDDNLCSIYKNFEVQNNSGTLQLVYGNAMNSDCGLSNGSIDISVSGGYYPITYLWSNGATTQDLINILPGTYTCTITDGSSCSIVTPAYNVNSNNNSLNFLYVNIKDEICNNSLGEIKTLVTGGAQPYSYLWSNGETTQNIYNLTEGIYSGTVTDNNGCVLSTGDLNLINTPGTFKLVNLTVTNEICSNQNGAIVLDVEGGTLPYLFNWNTNSISQNLVNVSAGTYSCEVSDFNGCAFTINAVVLNEQGALNIENYVVNNETCGNNSGSINLIVSGGSNPISYLWSNGETTEDLYGIHSGTYSVTISDAQSCSINGEKQVLNLSGDLIVSTQSVFNETCSSTNGSIDISVSGGLTPYSYLWSNGQTIQDLNNLSAGSYSCTITDGNGCSVSTSLITINNSAGGMLISNPIINPEICGNGNGSIDITVTGGTNPKTFLWSNSVNTEDISSLSANTYIVTVTDANNCSLTRSYVVENSSGTLSISNVQIIDEICSNTNGSINLSVNGGTIPYSFLWNNGANTQNISGLTSGNFSLTVTDNFGCSASSNLFKINNSAGNFSLVSINETSESCNNLNGTIDVNHIGGILPISYLWNNGLTTQNLTNLSAGLYSCTATDNVGCSLKYSTIVQKDAGNLTIASISSDALCGNSIGSIDITLSGGVLPYSINWNNGANTEHLNNLSAGFYSVYVEDSIGCSISKSIEVKSTNEIIVSSVNKLDEMCGNSQGEIEVIITGGEEPYQYNWGEDNPLPCENYTLNMYDSYGDSWNGAYLQVLKNGISLGNYSTSGSFTSENIPVCNGDVLKIIYNSGSYESEVSYSLDNSSGSSIFFDGPNPTTGEVFSTTVVSNVITINSNILTGIKEGTYTLNITDVNNCNATASATINNNTGNFVISTSNIVDDFCNSNEGAIDITISGGVQPYQYNWNTGATTQDLTNIASGEYFVNVTDLYGCKISKSFSILNNTGTLNFGTAVLNNTNCGDSTGVVDITVNANYLPLSFLWNNGSTNEDLVNIQAGIYEVTVTDSSGCAINQTFNIINQTNGLILETNLIQPQCKESNGAIDLIISGGFQPYSILWNNGNTNEDLTQLTDGIYTVKVTDSSACSTTETITLNSTSNIQINSINKTDEYCGDSNGSINVAFSGGQYPYSYNWSLANMSNCCEYTLNLYDLSSDGWNTNNVDVLVNGNLYGTYTPNVGDFNTTIKIPICNSDEIQLKYNEISDQNENYIYLSDIEGNLIYYTGPNPNSGILFTGTTSCNMNFPNSNILSNLNQGDYVIEITDANNCSISDTISIINNTNGFEISTINSTNDYCSNSVGAIDISISGGTIPYLYYWSNGSTTEDLLNLSAGNYTITVYDGNYCMLEKLITIQNIPGTLSLGNSAITNTYCGDSTGTIDLTILGEKTPFTITWSNGNTTEDLSNIFAGTYSVTVTDTSGCKFNETFDITNQTNGLNIAYTSVEPECGNNQGTINVTVSGGIEPYSFLWNNGNTNKDLTNLSEGTYIVTVTDSTSCSTSESIVITGTNNVVINSITKFDEDCGNSNGSISVAVSGGVAPYNYNWYLANTSSCCEYSLYLMDNSYNGWDNNNVEVLINGNLIGTYAPNNGDYYTIFKIPICNNDEIQLKYNEISIQNENYIYLVDVQGNIVYSEGSNPNSGIVYTGTTTCDMNFSTTNSLSYISKGDYVVVITDANGCSINDTISINNNTNGFEISTINLKDENCSNNDGTIDISVIGGIQPYQYYWSNGSVTEDLNNLSSGNYSVTIVDSYYCMIQQSFTIKNNISTLSFGTPNITNTYCGNAVGAIDVSILGAQIPYSILWSNGSTTEDLTNIYSGTYSIELTDTNNCKVNDTIVVINQTNGLALTSTTTPPNCSNLQGNIDLSIIGGISPYSILWNNGETSEDLTNVDGGLYSVSVTDSSGCIETENIQLSNSQSISISSITIIDDVCNKSQGEITVNTTGGTSPYTYQWSKQNETSCCSYTLKMYDSYGDSWNGGYLEIFINDVTIGQFSALGSETDANINVCEGDQIKLNYTSGSWESENSYKLYDSNDQLVFSNGPSPTSGVVFNQASTCGFVAPNTNHLVGLKAGIYDLSITESTGCSYQTSITLNNSNGDFAISNAIITDDNCGQTIGAINLSISGGILPYSYIWSNGAYFQDIQNINSGNYSVTVYDNAGCILNETYTVNNPSGNFDIIDSIVTNTYCGNNNGAINITVNDGVYPITYSWNNGQTTEDLSSLSSGIYEVIITDSLNCQIFSNFEIINETNGLSISDSLKSEICDIKGNIDLTISGGLPPYSYLWNNGATVQDLVNISGGIYSVSVTDNANCVETKTFTINESNSVSISSIQVINDACNNSQGEITVNPIGGILPYTYTWSSNIESQCCSYILKMNDSYGDSWNGGFLEVFINSIKIGQYYAINSSSIQNIDVCKGDEIKLIYTIGSWEEENTYQLENAAGVILFSNGPNPTSGTVYNSLVPSCNFNNTSSTNYLGGLSAGNYNVIIEEASGCSFNTSIVVDNISYQITDTLIQNASCFDCSDGSIIINTNSLTPLTYSWSNGETTKDISNVPAGTYTVNLTDANACSYVETYFVSYYTFNDFVENNLGTVELFPNPSKGIVNVSFKFNDLSEISVEVYDMLGQIVYISEKQIAKEGILKIDINNSKEGLFTVRLKVGDRFIQKKVVLLKM